MGEERREWAREGPGIMENRKGKCGNLSGVTSDAVRQSADRGATGAREKVGPSSESNPDPRAKEKEKPGVLDR